MVCWRSSTHLLTPTSPHPSGSLDLLVRLEEATEKSSPPGALAACRQLTSSLLPSPGSDPNTGATVMVQQSLCWEISLSYWGFLVLRSTVATHPRHAPPPSAWLVRKLPRHCQSRGSSIYLVAQTARETRHAAYGAPQILTGKLLPAEQEW